MRFSVIAFAILFSAGISASQDREYSRIEISSDGCQSVELSKPAHQETDSSGLRYNGVPYPLTSDWNNSIRRQVGGLAVADLNNDGRQDLYVGCYTSNSFPPYPDWTNLIYYNTGNSLEANPSWISADQRHTGDVQIGDINRDGYPDVFSANGGTAFAPSVIYYGGPTGPDNVPDWIASPPQATWCTAATLFDFDHDGDLDVFTTNQGVSPNPYRPMYGYRNNNGSLETSPFWQSDESSIQNGLSFGDFDGDGWEDLAVAKWVNFQPAIYKNILGALQTTPIWQSGNTGGNRCVSWTDVDGDGDLDLAIGASPPALFTNTNGTFSQTWTAQPTFVTQPEDMKFFDVDRDGDMDLAEIQFSTGRVNIYLNTAGQLSQTPSWSYDDASVGSAIAFGDINGDTWPDLVVGINGDISVRVFYARIPVIPGDMNCDGQVNLGDIEPMVLALLDPKGYAATFPYCGSSRGDLNFDTVLDGSDLQAFSLAVIGP